MIMGPGEKNNRRGFIRVPFHTVVEVRAAGRLIRSQEGVNISMGGLTLSTSETVPEPAAPCRVKIILDAAEHGVPIEADATVIRSHSGSLAVEFTALDPDSYQHLRKLILYNTADPDQAEQEFDAHWGIRKPGTVVRPK